MNRTIYQNTILLFMLFSIVACQSEEEQETSEKTTAEEHFQISETQFESNEMQLIAPKTIRVKQSIVCNGSIDVPPQNRAKITAIMGGYVKESPLLVGDFVEKGQVLVSLENPDYAELQEQYLNTQAELKYLQADYERQVELQKENINSTKDFQKIESDLKKAKAKQKSLAEKLSLIGIEATQLSTEKISSRIQIKSPITGTIAMVNISKGTYVNPTEALMEILDTDHMHLELDVFEKDILKVKKHQEIIFRLPELSAQKRRGEVHLIGNLLEKEKRSVKVHGHLDGVDSLHLAVGMFVEAEIVVGEESYQSVPSEAVYEIEGKTYLLVKLEEKEGKLLFDRYAIDVIEEKDGQIAFERKNGETVNQKVLAGAYHFIGENEGGGHHH
ncbi:MAG: efflux RND transporter periplasmic adaptor subunit [Vicingaceae bacterium]